MPDSMGFIIHVTHADNWDRVNPIVKRHLNALMTELCDENVIDPSIDCGPYPYSSAGPLQGSE